MSYPGATPEFRFLKKEDGTKVLQVRYVHIRFSYCSAWADVPVVEAQDG